ncbi:transcriptional regulator [Catellatospora sp. TT07R-123]|nr:transcriptional regulator [Catellatospora sp. TT07R-123]
MTSSPPDVPTATATRESHTFLIALMDTLGADFDVAVFVRTFVTGCVAMLDVGSAGLLLADQVGTLELAASSAGPAELVGRFETAHGTGPSIECHRTGLPVSCPAVSDLAIRWPSLADVVRTTGTTTLHAVPMRGHDDTIGALTLLSSGRNPSTETLQLARSLAEAATIGLLNQRTIRHHENTSAQLQAALTSRILIEQAKGILAGRLGITMDEAFSLLRGHARSNNSKLHVVAQRVLSGGMSIPGHTPEPNQQRLGRRS